MSQIWRPAWLSLWPKVGSSAKCSYFGTALNFWVKIGVGDPQVLALAAAVGDAQAAAIAFGQIVLEVRAQGLNRGRVHGCALER